MPEFPPVRVLAVDAGFASLGWSCIDIATDTVVACGAVATEPTAKKRSVRVADDDCRRCEELTYALDAVVANYRPAGLIVELPTGGAKGARANRCMGMATGVVAALGVHAGLPCEWTTPREGKLALVGKANATKDQVIAAARISHGMSVLDGVKPALREHAADAIAAWEAARRGQMVLTLRQRVANSEVTP